MVALVPPNPAHGADARDRDVLSIGVTEDERAALWPVELSLALEATRRGPAPLAPRTMVVRDGNRMVFDESVWTDRGLERFSLVVTPRHHAGGTVEVEWELAVWYQPYALRADAESWRTYLLYRAGLGPRPPLERPQLVAVRADIVECRGDAVLESIRVAGRDYALRIAARSTRPAVSPG
ncbi:MAG: hypothetical protein D6705_11335 [Deltaproteobacteria bacterium]|nr:MAG: hypothetical protein D6705_11335 [Deltaproteobacteria bacterium]